MNVFVWQRRHSLILDQLKSEATDKPFDLEKSDATTTLLRNVVKLVTPLLVAPLPPNTALDHDF